MRTKNQQTAALFDIVDKARAEVWARAAESDGTHTVCEITKTVANDIRLELSDWAKSYMDTHYHQGYRAHDANTFQSASECIPDDDVRRQWLEGWDDARKKTTA